MHTQWIGYDETHVDIISWHGDVRVRVESDTDGLPACHLSREAAHEALLKAKAKAEDFVAAVEGDLEATAP